MCGCVCVCVSLRPHALVAETWVIILFYFFFGNTLKQELGLYRLLRLHGVWITDHQRDMKAEDTFLWHGIKGTING